MSQLAAIDVVTAASQLMLAGQWTAATDLLTAARAGSQVLHGCVGALAALLRDEGDAAGSRALATEVHRWARQIGIPFIVQETAELMA